MPTFTPPFASILRLAALLVALLAFASTGWGQTFYDLAAGNYSESFADITNWTNNYASGTGASNWRVAGNATGSTGIANTAVFTTSTSGGVQKGTGTMVFLATGTNSGATDLLMNFNGRIAGNLSFSYAKIANTANNTSPRTSDLKIQYSTDNGTSFTDLSPFTVPRISNNSTAETGAIDAALPTALNGQSQVVIRFFFWNNGQTGGVGNRPKWEIDSVAITSTPSSSTDPTISAIPGSLTGLSYEVGNGPSVAQSFAVSAANLNPAGATVTVNATGTDFEVSSDNSTFSDSTDLTATAGTISSTTLYARLRAGRSIGSYANQSVSISGGNANATLTLSGSVTAPVVDYIPITSSGTPVSENFNGMGNSTTLPTAWKMHASTSSPTWSGANSTVTQQASSGSPSAGGTYNWGNTAGTDRSVGAMTSGGFASPNNLLAKLRNNTGSTLTNLSIDFQVERYRVNTAAASVELYYSTNGTSWTLIPGGNVTNSDLPTGTSAYNFAPGLTINRTSITQSGLSIANGADFYLRWNINTTGSNSQGIGIDDISITASGSAPTPAPAITSATTASATVGAPFTYTITASNTPTSFGATGLPAGLSVNSTTGAITGTPTTAGTTNATITATNSGGTGNATLAFTVAQGTPIITTPPTASAINAGQTLADSNLTGGNASVAGTFAFATPSFVPSATGSQVVVFTPTDAANYTTANTSVTVTVNPGQDSTFDTWTGGNVTMTPAILQTYAIGGGNYNGTVAPQTPVTTVAGGNLTLTAIVRTDDPSLTVNGEHKTDLTLGTWTSLGNGTATADQSGVPTGCERRAFSTPADGTKKFLRLRAVYNAN